MGFNGFRPQPHDEQACQQSLEAAMRSLGGRADLGDALGINPEPGKDPAARTDSARNVYTYWNIFRFGEYTDQDPHLTLGVGGNHDVSAMVTLPNRAKAGPWNSIRSGWLRRIVDEVLEGMTVEVECAGMTPRLRLRQRHYRPITGHHGRAPFLDAYLDIDLRTLRGDAAAHVKCHPGWIEAASRLVEAREPNLELQIGASFRYRDCPSISEPDSLNHVARAWIACRPFIERLGVLP